MLVLTRKPGDDVLLRNDDGTLTRLKLLTIKDGRIRLGISAPESVTIWREELGPMPERTKLAAGHG